MDWLDNETGQSQWVLVQNQGSNKIVSSYVLFESKQEIEKILSEISHYLLTKEFYHYFHVSKKFEKALVTYIAAQCKPSTKKLIRLAGYLNTSSGQEKIQALYGGDAKNLPYLDNETDFKIRTICVSIIMGGIGYISDVADVSWFGRFKKPDYTYVS